MRPAIDFETYSSAGHCWDAEAQKWRAPPGAREKGLSAVGAPVYSEHPSTEVLTVSYDLCDGAGVRRWRPGQKAARVVHCKREPYDVYCGRPEPLGNQFEIGRDGDRATVIAKHRTWLLADWSRVAACRRLVGKTLGCWCAPEACHCDTYAEFAALPWDLFDYILRPGAELESHNAMFERLIWTNVCVPRYGWPPLPALVQRCSMATARTNAYPGKLENLGEVLRLDARKDAEGKRLLKKFSVPRDPTKKDPRLRIRPEDDPEDFERLCQYCDQDVRTEQEASSKLVQMSPSELAAWQLNQAINWRGLRIDRAGVRDCIAVLEACMDRYGAECRELTGGIAPSQVQALVGWVAGRMSTARTPGPLVVDQIRPEAPYAELPPPPPDPWDRSVPRIAPRLPPPPKDRSCADCGAPCVGTWCERCEDIPF